MIQTGKAILTAGLTTAGGLAVLILARFKGFSEFGIIATMGIVLCLVVYLVLLPAMAVVWERFSVPRPWRKYDADEKRGIKRHAPWPLKRVRICLGLVVVAFIGSALCLPFLEFEYNFRNLRGKKVSATIKWGKTVSSSSSPVVAVLGLVKLVLPPQGAAMHLLQHIRDEAHRFAITGHRQRRARARKASELEGIAGVGQKRRRELLRHFGSVAGVKGASSEEIAKVPGISRKLAEDIYAVLHTN